MDLWTVWAVVLAFVFGRSMLFWGFLTYTFGWWMVIPLSFFGINERAWRRRKFYADKISEYVDKLDQKLKPKEYQDFNTVDDLFKQLENK